MIKAMNQKLAQPRSEGYFAIRVFHTGKKGKRDPRFVFKCGCCDQKLEVYYGEDSLEINGVMGSVENWRELLRPLLEMKLPGQGKSRVARSRAVRASVAKAKRILRRAGRGKPPVPGDEL